MAKDNSIIIDNETRGISNEEYWYLGSVYNAEWVNIRESNKYYSLDWYNSAMNKISDSSNSWITAMYVPSTLYGHYVSYDGWVYGWLYNYSNGWGAIFDSSYFYVNTTVVKVWSTRYGIAIGTASLHRRVYDGNNYNLGLLWSDVVVNGDLTTDSDWTKWTGWTINTWTNQAEHAAGSASDFSQVLTVTNATKYRIQFNVYRQAGTLDIKMWGATLWTVSDNSMWTRSYYRTTAGVSETLEFSASADFVGTVSYIRVNLTNMQENYAYGWDTMVTSSYHPFIYSGSFLYIAWGNTVTQFDLTATPWLATNLLVLWADETIIAMTNIWTRYYIYTNDTDWNRGRQYLWDGVSKQPDEMIEWPKRKFRWVKNNWTFDYVVTGKNNYRELYKVSGWERTKLYQSGYISNYSTDRMAFIPAEIYAQPMDMVRDVVYIAGSGWLHSFWSELPWIPESLSKNALLPWASIYAVQADMTGNYLYSSMFIAGKPRVYYTNIQNVNNTYNPQYWSTGFVEYNPLLRDKLSSIKKLEKLQIGYQLAGSRTSIQIYMKIDDWAYTLIKTITGTGNTAYYGRSAVMTNDFITANAGMKFYKAQFKVVLNTTASSKTPKIFDFGIKTDDILDTF